MLTREGQEKGKCLSHTSNRELHSTKYVRIGLFRYIKILTSIRGWDVETREITLRPKGIRRYLVFSFTASQPRSEAEYLIY
jgi:hypothetical protein